MPPVTSEIADLKNEILAKIDEELREFKSDPKLKIRQKMKLVKIS